jgi:hypothetical protein
MLYQLSYVRAPLRLAIFEAFREAWISPVEARRRKRKTPRAVVKKGHPETV